MKFPAMKHLFTWSRRALAAVILGVSTMPVHATGWVPPATPRKFSVIEALGAPGTTVTIAVQVPSGGVGLWIKGHGLNYQNKASIRVNGGDWVALNNTNCVFDYPGDRLRGMGGPLDTLSFRVLGVALIPRRANTISFRYNYSDGVSIGYRILDLNILNAANRRLLPESQPVFVRARTTNLSPSDVAAGSNLWYNASLRQNWIGASMNAKCADCHAEDGSDLKYYSYSDKSISERARFHGLSLTEGRQVATYIRSLPIKSPGTPWDPPFQPGPGLDSKPADEFAAGAGLAWVLPDDSLSFDYMFPDGNPTIKFTNTLNIRELPIAMPLPDWNSWLPRVHPKDSYGTNFQIVYDGLKRVRDEQDTSRMLDRFSEWHVSLVNWMLGPAEDSPPQFRDGSATAYRAWWSVGRWRTVKAWEIMKAKVLEDKGAQMFDWPVSPRSWPVHSIFLSSPHFTIQPEEGHFLRDGSREVWNVLSHQWYWLQMVLNDSNHRRRGAFPIDWQYLLAFSQNQLYFGLGSTAQIIAASIKAGETTTTNPTDPYDGFTGFTGPSTEYLWVRDIPQDMWAGYDPVFRDQVIRAQLGEYARMVHLVGRDYFRDVTGELLDGETDNSPGALRARPWIRSHAGVLNNFKKAGVSQDIVDTMKELGQFLWPAADWSRY